MRRLAKAITRALVFVLRRLPSGIDYLVDVCLAEDLRRFAAETPPRFEDPYSHIRAAVRALGRGGEGTVVVVDVGAARGDTAALFLSLVENPRVYAFEPMADAYAELARRYTGDRRVVARRVALGADRGSATLKITRNPGSSSLLPVADADHLTSDLAEYFSGQGEETVPLGTLDEELAEEGRVAILKIDVQGAELSVLRGARRVLPRTDVVVLEMANHRLYSGGAAYYEVDEVLRSHGFTVAALLPSWTRGRRLMEWNAVYVSGRMADAETLGTSGVSHGS